MAGGDVEDVDALTFGERDGLRLVADVLADREPYAFADLPLAVNVGGGALDQHGVHPFELVDGGVSRLPGEAPAEVEGLHAEQISISVAAPS